MKTAIKTEFLCVKPRTDYAREIFEQYMSKLHSCRVIKRERGRVYLDSISNRYSFDIFECNDDDWEIIT